MKIKIKLFLCLIISCFSLVACNEKEDLTIYEGYIVDKIYDQGYTYTTYIKSGSVMVPIIHTIPDKWYIVIYKDEQIAKHQVTEEFYNTFTIGSYVILDTTMIEECYK